MGFTYGIKYNFPRKFAENLFPNILVKARVCTYICIYTYIYIYIDCLPRRPNHSLTDSSLQFRNIFDTFFDTFFNQKCVLGLLGVPSKPSWAVLGGPWGTFGPSWAVLGDSGGSPGVPWEAPGAPWGDPKSIKNSIRNLIRKQVEIELHRCGPNTTPVMVSALSEPRRTSDDLTRKCYQTRYRYD